MLTEYALRYSRYECVYQLRDEIDTEEGKPTFFDRRRRRRSADGVIGEDEFVDFGTEFLTDGICDPTSSSMS